MAAQEADLDVCDAEGRVAGRTVALGRYDALRDARPEMFAGAGPVVIVDPASSPHAGVVYADPWIMLIVDAVRPAAELLEETGLLADIEPLGILHPDSGSLSFEVTLHLARVRPGQTPVADERLAFIVEMTFAEFETAIASGRISDSFTIAAWTRYALTGR